ncbi:MAG: methyltransferase domain-containing protein [bacterium]
MTQAPFDDGQFDVVFSNHVIEHIDDVTGALREVRRIGAASCIYAFFVDCYRNFKIAGWKRLFSDNGFSVIKIRPLLLYGPSNWPVIPVLNSRKGICSSVLFLMKKQGQPDLARQ